MPPKPPSLDPVKIGGKAKAGPKKKTTTGSVAKKADPFGLSTGNYGDLAHHPINGAREMLGVAQTGPSGWNAMPASTRRLDATETLHHFKELSGPALADIQSKMWRAGLYSGSDQPTYGAMTARDIDAFRKLVIGLAANPNQGTLSEYLDYGAQMGDEINAADGGSTRAPLITQLTNPIDLENVARNVARTLYAGAMNQQELDQFISSYQSAEASYQSQGYGMGESGGTITQPASASASAEKFLRDNHGDQVNASEFGNVLDTYLSLIRSGGR